MSKFTYKDVKGIIAPLITPLKENSGLKEDGKIDEKGVEKLVKHVLGKNERPYVDALLVNGLTGEAPWLDKDQQKAMFDVVVAECDGGIPVIFGAFGKTEEETIELCEYGEDNGADAVLVPPFYFHPSNRGLPKVMERVAGSVSIPVYLYISSAFGKLIKTDIFKRILLENDNVWGLKYSSRELKGFENYCKAARHKPGARVFMGDETKMIHSLDSIPSFSNLDPKTCRHLNNENLDFETGRKFGIQNYICEAGNTIYCRYKKIRAGLKYALSFIGICNEKVLEPCEELSLDERLNIKRFVIENYT